MNAAHPGARPGIVVTRPRAAGEALAAMLERAGLQAVVFPALAIEPLPMSPELEAALALLPACDLAIFVSANAVEHGLRHARSRGRWPECTRVAAIGEATAQALRSAGFDAVIAPAGRHDSEALLERHELKTVHGRHILIFRGRGGREALREALAARGAHVTYAECYRRIRPDADPAPLIGAWEAGRIQAVSVLSAETLENFTALVGERGRRLFASATLVVPLVAVAAHPLARVFASVRVAPSEVAIARALVPAPSNR